METFDTTVNTVLAEDWRGAAAAGLLGLSTMVGGAEAGSAPVTQPPAKQVQAQAEDAKFSVVNPEKPGIPANAKPWKGIVVHHTESSQGSAKDIDSWHRNRKKDPFNEIGYNYVIQKNGVVEKGRSLTKSGAHAKSGKPYSRNSTHIGIVLVKKEGEAPTLAQTKSLGRLILSLMKHFDIQTIERHHEQCPGKEVNVETLNNTLQEIRKTKKQ